MVEDTQVGGDHYRKVEGEQHWDRVVRLGLSYFQGNATAYIERALEKGNAVEDLKKAAHYCHKLADLIQTGKIIPKNTRDPHHPDMIIMRKDDVAWLTRSLLEDEVFKNFLRANLLDVQVILYNNGPRNVRPQPHPPVTYGPDALGAITE